MTEHEQYDILRDRRPQRERIGCVFLTCIRSDFSFLATTLRYSGIRMLRAESLDEADFMLTVTGGSVFLSDITFPDGTWRDALYMASEMHPRAASLIVADPVDHPFLSDAYARGACGVIWKPFDFSQAIEMIRAIDQAVRDRAIWLAESSVSPKPKNLAYSHLRR